MRALTETEILQIWEAGAGQHPLERGLTILRCAGLGDGAAPVAEWPVGERDRRLWTLRQQTFGAQVESQTECPQCGGAVEFGFRVPDVLTDAPADACREEHTWRDGAWTAHFRLPNTRDLAALTRLPTPEAARHALAQRCLLGLSRESEAVPVAECPAEVVSGLERAMAALDPQAEVEFRLDCPVCGHGWTAWFDIAAFFWTELHAVAGQLLREVDQLARAYGWSEAQILNLSPVRRQAYLELAG